jgi:uncharacterized protein with HEPN domain
MTDRPVSAWLRDARDYSRSAHDIALSAEKSRLETRDRMAIRYCLMVTGEALNSVAQDVLYQEPQIPWRQIIALRNRLVHGYWLVDESILDEIVRVDIEPVVGALDRLLGRNP